MRVQPALLLVGSTFCCAAAQLGAQEAGQPVSLAFKYKTGQVQKFSSEVKTEATIELGGGGGLGPIPFTMNMKHGYSEKVIGTRQGTGTLSALLESPTVAVNAVGQEFTFKKKGTKTIVTQGGQPVDIASVSGPVQSVESILKPYKAVLRRSPAGELSPVSGATNELTSLLSGGFVGPSLRLPEGPVKPGDTWELSSQVQLTIPGPVPSLSGPQELEMKTTYTLKAVDRKGGKQFALIESQGVAEGTTPQGTAAVSQKGTTRFDIARGAVVSGKYSMTLNVAGAAAPGGDGAPAAGGSRMDAVVDAVMREVPAAVAPAKKGKRK